MGQGGQYATQLNVYFRDRDDGTVFAKNYTHITDVPHSPAEAAAAAYGEYEDEAKSSRYRNSVAGWSVRNVYETEALNR